MGADRRRARDVWATCPGTELGLMRVCAQLPVGQRAPAATADALGLFPDRVAWLSLVQRPVRNWTIADSNTRVPAHRLRGLQNLHPRFKSGRRLQFLLMFLRYFPHGGRVIGRSITRSITIGLENAPLRSKGFGTAIHRIHPSRCEFEVRPSNVFRIRESNAFAPLPIVS